MHNPINKAQRWHVMDVSPASYSLVESWNTKTQALLAVEALTHDHPTHKFVAVESKEES